MNQDIVSAACWVILLALYVAWLARRFRAGGRALIDPLLDHYRNELHHPGLQGSAKPEVCRPAAGPRGAAYQESRTTSGIADLPPRTR